MARYPWVHTSSRLVDPMILKQLKRRRQMKGGTIFGLSTRMRMGDPRQVLWANQEKARRQRWLQQRMRKGIKRGRR